MFKRPHLHFVLISVNFCLELSIITVTKGKKVALKTGRRGRRKEKKVGENTYRINSVKLRDKERKN